MKSRSPIIYPLLGSSIDAGWLRVSGHGLGNSFYSYFHSFIIGIQEGAKIISPPWASVKPRRILLGRVSERSYFGLMAPAADELVGLQKFTSLLRPRRFLNANDVDVTLSESHLNIVYCKPFRFGRLKNYRDEVRGRLIEIAQNLDVAPQWGAGSYIAAHIRLGDFGPEITEAELQSGQANRRIPLAWYRAVLARISARHPGIPIRVVSDGTDEELDALLGDGVEVLRTGSDLGDLFALAGASVLVGSNSTFSRWAAFLGDMPSVWLAKPLPDEKPTSEGTPIAYASLSGDMQDLW